MIAGRRTLLIIIGAFLAALAGVFIGRGLVAQREAPGAELHSVLHDRLDLDAGQKARLETLERQFAVRRKAIELELRADNALLAEAISTDSGLSEAAFLYGLVLTVGGIFFNALWLYELGRPRAGNDLPHVRRHFTLISVRFALGPVSYLAATLISLKYPVLAIVLYVALIAYYWFPGRSETVFSGRD